MSTKQLVMYDVKFNGICVGMLSGDDYDTIKGKVFRDPRTYVNQFCNLTSMLFNTVGKLFLVFPIMAFWIIFAILYMDPKSYLDLQSFLQQEPEAIMDMVNRFFWLMACLWILTYLILSTWRNGHPAGFQNCFRNSIELLIRKKFDLLWTHGQLLMTRHEFKDISQEGADAAGMEFAQK